MIFSLIKMYYVSIAMRYGSAKSNILIVVTTTEEYEKRIWLKLDTFLNEQISCFNRMILPPLLKFWHRFVISVQ